MEDMNTRFMLKLQSSKIPQATQKQMENSVKHGIKKFMQNGGLKVR